MVGSFRFEFLLMHWNNINTVQIIEKFTFVNPEVEVYGCESNNTFIWFNILASVFDIQIINDFANFVRIGFSKMNLNCMTYFLFFQY